MKTTYLINKEQADGSVCLAVATSSEWLAVVNANKKLPSEQRRYFILDYIKDGNDLDCIVMEAPAAAYHEWDRQRLAARRNRKAGEKFQHLSLDALTLNDEDALCLSDRIPSETQVEADACDLTLIDELRAKLAAWKPWANDLLDMYLQGQKRACTDALAKKYGVSPQVVRKYKRQFEEFIKNFLKGVSF